MTTLAPEPVSHTSNFVDLETKDGKQFLRRVIRENIKHSCLSGEQWIAHASASTEFTLEFYRRVRGNVGDPEQEIRVRTTTKFSMHYRPGEKQSFHDSHPVMLAECHRLHFSANETSFLCHWLTKETGVRLSIEGHAGSTSSSKHGLSFYCVQAHWPALPQYTNVQIGGDTVAINGQTVCSGSVDLRR